jgi:hypothetical protein
MFIMQPESKAYTIMDNKKRGWRYIIYNFFTLVCTKLKTDMLLPVLRKLSVPVSNISGHTCILTCRTTDTMFHG